MELEDLTISLHLLDPQRSRSTHDVQRGGAGPHLALARDFYDVPFFSRTHIGGGECPSCSSPYNESEQQEF